MDHPPAAPAARPASLDDPGAIIYIDGYSNSMTDVRAASVREGWTLELAGKSTAPARAFADVAEEFPLAYENAWGLLEMAANRGRAAAILGFELGPALAIGEHIAAPHPTAYGKAAVGASPSGKGAGSGSAICPPAPAKPWRIALLSLLETSLKKYADPKKRLHRFCDMLLSIVATTMLKVC